jgi:uncharacterized protein with NRDE domain
MCLAVFSYQPGEAVPFILAANRDEFFKRETREAQYWDDIPGLVAGKDLEAGGSWLGIFQNGDMAFLTNYRDPKYFRFSKKTRGDLVTGFFQRKSLADFQDKLNKTQNDYNGYNLIFGNPNSGIYYYSNVNGVMENLKPGTYGLSNAFLNDPWPKVIATKNRFEKAVFADQSAEEMFKILSSSEKPSDNALPNTGIGLEMERKLSSAFIRMENYGTRCSSYLKYNRDEGATFIERSYKEDPKDYYDSLFSIRF